MRETTLNAKNQRKCVKIPNLLFGSQLGLSANPFPNSKNRDFYTKRKQISVKLRTISFDIAFRIAFDIQRKK